MIAEAPERGAAPTRPARRPRRWIDTASVALVLGALGLTVLAATPSLLRVAGLGGARPERESPAAGRFVLPGSTAAPGGHGFFAPPDDDDDEPPSPHGIVPPGQRSAEDRHRWREIFPGQRDPDDEPERAGPRVHDPSPSAGESRARFGLVRHRISLLEKPTQGARSLGDVMRGETVMVIKESGDYALVAYSGEDGVLMGWAPKSEIAVR